MVDPGPRQLPDRHDLRSTGGRHVVGQRRPGNRDGQLADGRAVTGREPVHHVAGLVAHAVRHDRVVGPVIDRPRGTVLTVAPAAGPRPRPISHPAGARCTARAPRLHGHRLVGLGAKNAVPARSRPIGRSPSTAHRRCSSNSWRASTCEPDGRQPRRVRRLRHRRRGYNYPFWDPPGSTARSTASSHARAGRRQVRLLGDAARGQAAVHHAGAWTQVQPYYWYFPTVNEHLRAAVARHPDLSLIDWAAIADRPGLTYDAIHLNTFGASEYAANIARVVMSAASRLPAGSTTTVKVVGTTGVPADATAASLNLTVTNPRTPGFLTAYPCDQQRPLAEQRQLHERQHRRCRGDRAARSRRNGVRVHECRHRSDHRCDGSVRRTDGVHPPGRRASPTRGISAAQVGRPQPASRPATDLRCRWSGNPQRHCRRRSAGRVRHGLPVR